MTNQHENCEIGFEALYLKDKLTLVNPRGFAGIVTLWSKVDNVLSALKQLGVDLGTDTSAVAVVANLYGDGLADMLANLLYNPQIDLLVIWGKNLSGSKLELINFFEQGVTDPDPKYGMVNIKGTSRKIPLVLSPELFQRRPRIVDLGEDLRNGDVSVLARVLGEDHGPSPGERVKVELPELKVETKPSAPSNHSLVAETPCEAWRELLFVLREFGKTNTHDTSGGDRLELLNVRVTIRKPVEESEETLREHSLDPAKLRDYQAKMLDPVCPADVEYTYGSRLKTYFGLNALEECERLLRHELGTRHGYISLWDSRRDLRLGEPPCLVSLFFRVYDEAVTLTATFRAHNAGTAWILNVYGLIRVLNEMAAKLDVPVGPLIVISESISLRKSEMQKVAEVIDKYTRKYQHYREDPKGYFEITLDNDGIVAIQRSSGVMINRFEGRTAQIIEHEVAKNHAISEISHALYLGRELTRAEQCLRRGEPYIQS